LSSAITSRWVATAVTTFDVNQSRLDASRSPSPPLSWGIKAPPME
jgi:hypothetical protein